MTSPLPLGLARILKKTLASNRGTRKLICKLDGAADVKTARRLVNALNAELVRLGAESRQLRLEEMAA